jgi:hypothetical protein
MVQLTDQAARELKALKEVNRFEPAEGIRLIPDGDGIGAVAGAPVEGDEVLGRDGEPLLMVDHRLAQALRDVTVDCFEIEEAGQVRQAFTLRAA